jgi:Ca2+-binding EF-hand superfamily protein
MAQWNSPIKTGPPATQQELEAVIRALRFKLIQKTNGTSDEFLLRKVFDEFDINRNSSISAYELDLMLKELELPTPAKLISPLMLHLDKNKSGYI